MKKIIIPAKLTFLIFTIIFSWGKAFAQPIVVTADPGVENFTLRNLDFSPANAMSLEQGTVYYLDIVFKNQHALNDIPTLSAYLLLGLGLNLILDPTFDISTAGYSQYMAWLYEAPSNGQQGRIAGTVQAAPLPASFTGTARFRVLAHAPGFSTLTANFNTNNRNPAYILVDGNPSNNITNLSYGVIVSNPLTINSVTTANVSCNGGNNGTITVSASGGTLPYEFSKDNGVTWVTGQNSPYTFTGLAAGSYLIKVRDGANSIVTYGSNPVVISQPAALTANADGTNASCTNTGTATVNVNGGTSPFTYVWSPG